MPNRSKRFDCVGMNCQGADKIRRAIRGMNQNEELVYRSQGTARLLEQQASIRRTMGNAPNGRKPSGRIGVRVEGIGN